MPKRSLNSGQGGQRKVEQLNQAIDATLARTDGRPPKVEAGIEPLARIAADLRVLPRQDFKTRLKKSFERSTSMATVSQPTTALRTFASPRLSFKSAAKAISFYEKAFGAKESWRFETEHGVGHAEVMIGDSVFTLCEEWPEGGRYSAETLGQSPISMTIQTPDVDAFVKHAVAAGAKLTMPPTDQFYGHRDASLLDPFGYTWNIHSIKEEMSIGEMHRRFKKMMAGPEGGKVSEDEIRKGVSPIRPGFRMVTPYLVAEDGPALLDFAKQAFGAEELLRAQTPTGVHGEVRIGDSIVMIGGGVAGKKFPSTLHPTALHVYVEDADAVTQKAVAAGATLIGEPRDQDYGERSASVRDRAGNFWYIATHKGESYIPKGLYNVNPYLHPLRAEPLIGFLKRAFGAQEAVKEASPDGVVHHAQIRVGNSVVEMGEAHGKHEPMPAMFYLYVPNVDAAYRRAVAAGATSFQQPTDQPYGDRNAGVRDSFGNTWYIATHMKDMTR